MSREGRERQHSEASSAPPGALRQPARSPALSSAADRAPVLLTAGLCCPPAHRAPDTGLRGLHLHLRVSGDDSNETVTEKRFYPTHVFSLQPYN